METLGEDRVLLTCAATRTVELHLEVCVCVCVCKCVVCVCVQGCVCVWGGGGGVSTYSNKYYEVPSLQVHTIVCHMMQMCRH